MFAVDDILADIWKPCDSLISAVPILLSSLGLPVKLNENTVEMLYVNNHKVGVVVCKSVKPHVDTHFPGRTALFVLQSAKHVIGVSNRIPTNDTSLTLRRPKHKKLVELSVGDMFLFNAHSTHWMDFVSDTLFAACTFDFTQTPSRNEVETEAMCQLGLTV